jgi:hypothetical protein
MRPSSVVLFVVWFVDTPGAADVIQLELKNAKVKLRIDLSPDRFFILEMSEVTVKKPPVRYLYGEAFPKLTSDADSMKNNKLSFKTNAAVENQGEIPFGEFRTQFYNDPAVFLRESSIALNKVYGKPIFINHDPTKQVGIIVEAWKKSDDPNKVISLLKITDPKTIEDVDQGKYRALSMGYEVGLEESEEDGGSRSVTGTTVVELSLCEDPFYKPCRVTILASKYPSIIDK